jgi:ribosome biogenesis GTPase A
MAEAEKEEVARKLAEKELIKQQKIEQEKLKRSGKRYND